MLPSLRIPPPTSTFSDVSRQIVSITSWWITRPAFAPSRSTTCNHVHPAASIRFAWSNGVMA